MWGGSKLSSSGSRILEGLRLGFQRTQADSSRLTTSAGECVYVCYAHEALGAECSAQARYRAAGWVPRGLGQVCVFGAGPSCESNARPRLLPSLSQRLGKVAED